MICTLLVFLAVLVSSGQSQPQTAPQARPQTQPVVRPAAKAAEQPALKTESQSSPQVAPAPKRMEWTIDGVKREAVVFAPPIATGLPTPVVFGFHGHGGTMRYAAIKFGYQREWPEAITVYMQGLPTAGMTDPEGKKPGWQQSAGTEGDRDLKFFDAVLATLKQEYKVDENRIYAAGHSNGGAFTYLLWKERADVFAAFAPAAAALRGARDFKPKPAIHIAGTKDQIVWFRAQNLMMQAVRKVDGCEDEGKPWAKDCLIYESKTGTPFVSMIYDGDHTFPEEAPALIVKFFKEQVRSTAGNPPAEKAKPALTPAAPASAK